MCRIHFRKENHLKAVMLTQVRFFQVSSPYNTLIQDDAPGEQKCQQRSVKCQDRQGQTYLGQA